jgi:hypothetical protein
MTARLVEALNSPSYADWAWTTQPKAVRASDGSRDEF